MLLDLVPAFHHKREAQPHPATGVPPRSSLIWLIIHAGDDWMAGETTDGWWRIFPSHGAGQRCWHAGGREKKKNCHQMTPLFRAARLRVSTLKTQHGTRETKPQCGPVFHPAPGTALTLTDGWLPVFSFLPIGALLAPGGQGAHRA